MKITTKKLLALSLVVLVFVLAACGLTPAEVDKAVATVGSMSPSELANLAATVETLPEEQIAAVATSAAAAGFATLSPADVQAVQSTVAAARATATAVGEAVNAGERVNATQAPQEAPIIVYFFAQVPSESGIQDGVRYYLNWTTVNANRVEIFGNVMADPQQGSWPIYNESNDWTLWAANDQVWVEQFLHVTGDSATGATLQNVSVDSTNITMSFRDPQFVDGDIINVDVNGVRVLDRFTTQGRDVSFPVALKSGQNTVAINTQSEGVTPPLVVQVTVSNVTSGPATQVSGGLNKGETQSFTITAP